MVLSWTIILTGILFIILSFYLGTILVLYFQQERLLFYPVELPEDYSFNQFAEAEEVFLSRSPGDILHGLHFRQENPRGVILYFHGNARALHSWGYQAYFFMELGFDVVMMDYRGFGKSRGKRSYTRFHDDARRWYAYTVRQYPASKIILYGRSLGSGPATRLASEVRARYLILETPYLSILDVAQESYWFLPLKYLIRFPFDNGKYIRQINCPVHIFHGTADAYIPYEQAVQLAIIAGGEHLLTTVEGGMHNDIPAFPAYRKWFERL